MTGIPHSHTTLVDGCFRCNLNKDEFAAAQEGDQKIADGLHEMADWFQTRELFANAAFLRQVAKDYEAPEMKEEA